MTAQLGRLDHDRKVSTCRHPSGNENTPRPIGPPICVWSAVGFIAISQEGGGGSRYPPSRFHHIVHAKSPQPPHFYRKCCCLELKIRTIYAGNIHYYSTDMRTVHGTLLMAWAWNRQTYRVQAKDSMTLGAAQR